ncbi:MAG TPA: N-acetyl-1-D-myo-inositol-2-amino-2-deoxy-alpha-D-glucopyranoside deacetylase [Kineosporiaceae bacterium]|nr:N-acetyl-1-D-myo-inositol-2-amino-2-deoxy-alpha-D-glucopyranoside deacetylase [Kineosporiaceae bacterium]
MAISSTPASSDRRLLLVHAHPDDETINNGATMARYAAEGTHVTLITCTRGEMGEVIPSELAYLGADRQDTLGEHRVGELAAAMAELGVTDHRFLDELDGPFEPVHYRDSGMAWGPDGTAVAAPDTRPGAFALADIDDAAARLASVVRQQRPQVVVTYEPGGGYGHPDHVQAHRVTMRALELAEQPGPGGDAWQVPKVYWVVIPERLARQLLSSLAAAGDNPFESWAGDGPLPSMMVPDELVSTVIDGSAHLSAKIAALRAHVTQIAVDGPFFALSNGVGQPTVALEFYRLVHGAPGLPKDADGREIDLFAGLSSPSASPSASPSSSSSSSSPSMSPLSSTG